MGVKMTLFGTNVSKNTLGCLWNETFFLQNYVNMNAWYEKRAKIWIFKRKIKFKVTCLPLKSGEL